MSHIENKVNDPLFRDWKAEIESIRIRKSRLEDFLRRLEEDKREGLSEDIKQTRSY